MRIQAHLIGFANQLMLNIASLWSWNGSDGRNEIKICNNNFILKILIYVSSYNCLHGFDICKASFENVNKLE